MIFMKVLALRTNNEAAFTAVFCFPNGEPRLRHGEYDRDDFLAVMNKTDLELFPENSNLAIIPQPLNASIRDAIIRSTQTKE